MHEQTSTPDAAPALERDHYLDLLRAVADRVERFVKAATPGDRVLYRTDARDLPAAFLGSLPTADLQRRHMCRACDDFIERYGGLVTVDEAGGVESPVWPSASATSSAEPDLGPYAAAVAALQRLVRRARVVGVFVPERAQLGLPSNEDRARGCAWYHLAARLDPAMVWRDRLKTASQREAELAEHHGMVGRALGDYGEDLLRLVLAMAEAGKLARDEKITGPARWLLDLHDRRRHARDARRADAMLWRAVATAPVGFAGLRGGVLGSLLDDLKAGMSQDDAARRFAARMAGDQYQRPQAPPTAGNVRRAEEVVSRLGIASALDRRFARLADVSRGVAWTPAPELSGPPLDGVFGHLVRPAKKAPTDVAGMTTVTWAKFARDVLPRAEALEVFLPHARINLGAFLVASDPLAPPILQWDHEHDRNTASVYVYVGGSTPARWGLAAGEYHPVTAVVRFPWLWSGGRPTNKADGLALVVKGAKDRQHTGLALFPENLRPELHEVRATIEAHSKTRDASGADEAEVCGLFYGAGTTIPMRVRVVAAGVPDRPLGVTDMSRETHQYKPDDLVRVVGHRPEHHHRIARVAAFVGGQVCVAFALNPFVSAIWLPLGAVEPAPWATPDMVGKVDARVLVPATGRGPAADRARELLRAILAHQVGNELRRLNPELEARVREVANEEPTADAVDPGDVARKCRLFEELHRAINDENLLPEEPASDSAVPGVLRVLRWVKRRREDAAELARAKELTGHAGTDAATLEPVVQQVVDVVAAGAPGDPVPAVLLPAHFIAAVTIAARTAKQRRATEQWVRRVCECAGVSLEENLEWRVDQLVGLARRVLGLADDVEPADVSGDDALATVNDWRDARSCLERVAGTLEIPAGSYETIERRVGELAQRDAAAAEPRATCDALAVALRLPYGDHAALVERVKQLCTFFERTRAAVGPTDTDDPVIVTMRLDELAAAYAGEQSRAQVERDQWVERWHNLSRALGFEKRVPLEDTFRRAETLLAERGALEAELDRVRGALRLVDGEDVEAAVADLRSTVDVLRDRLSVRADSGLASAVSDLQREAVDLRVALGQADKLRRELAAALGFPDNTYPGDEGLVDAARRIADLLRRAIGAATYGWPSEVKLHSVFEQRGTAVTPTAARLRSADGYELLVHREDLVDDADQIARRRAALEREASSPPEANERPRLRVVPDACTQPHDEPPRCEPRPRRAPWADNRKVGAVYVEGEPGGTTRVSLVITGDDGVARQATNMSGLRPDQVEEAVGLVGRQLAERAASIAARKGAAS